MMYTIVPNPDVELTFRKMGKKDAARFGQVIKKLGENPEMGKPLRRPMQGPVAGSYRTFCPVLRD